MARKVETEQSKNKKKKKKIIIICVVVALIIVGAVILICNLNKKGNGNPVEVKILEQNVDYGYSLSDRDSKLYKDEYSNLKKLIEAKEVDLEAYTTQVAKMFVIDLYSMETKLNMYDIGGSEYYFADKKDMFDTKVMDTMYSTLEDDTYGDRKQELPLVKSIEVVSSEKTEYTMGEEKKEAYSVKLQWTYEKDLGYDSEGTVVIVNEEGNPRWSVVDFQPTLNPKYDVKKK